MKICFAEQIIIESRPFHDGAPIISCCCVWKRDDMMTQRMKNTWFDFYLKMFIQDVDDVHEGWIRTIRSLIHNKQTVQWSDLLNCDVDAHIRETASDDTLGGTI